MNPLSSAVPLSPMHPSSQLEYFVNDSDASVIITTDKLSQNVTPIISGQQVSNTFIYYSHKFT